jgi:5-methylcytosine-specific restriction endonuclease McrA
MRSYEEVVSQVSAKYRCQHVETEQRNKPDKNGRPLVARQCVTCGERVGEVIPAKELSRHQIAGLPLWNKDLEQAYWRQMLGEAYQQRESERMRTLEQAAWRRKYDAYLSTSKWKALREKVLLRAKGLCEGCGERRATQVHHLTYERLGNEMLFDLVAVCHDCQKQIHPGRRGAQSLRQQRLW